MKIWLTSLGLVLALLAYATPSHEISNFEFPFLTASTAKASTQTPAETANRVREYLRQGKFAREKLVVPQVVIQGEQLEGLKECNVDKCLMKLNTQKEKGVVEKATDKVAAYKGLVQDRLNRYAKTKELLGYEDRSSNESFVIKMLSTVPFLKSRYPTVEKFFRQDFFTSNRKPTALVDTFFRQEMFVVAPERLQPIWRVSEVFEFKGEGTLFVEVHVYSNHYLDSSMRFYEILPVDGKGVLTITDVLEIDELTGSSIVRMLYLGKMKQAVRVVQIEDLDKIL